MKGLKEYLPSWGTLLSGFLFCLVVPRFSWSWAILPLLFVPFHYELNRNFSFSKHVKEAFWLMLAWGIIAYAWMPEAAASRWKGGLPIIWAVFFILCPILNSLLLFYTLFRNLMARQLNGMTFVITSGACFVILEYFLIYLNIKVGDYFYTNPALLSWASIGGVSSLSFFVIFFSELVNLDFPRRKYVRSLFFLGFFIVSSYSIYFLNKSAPILKFVKVSFLHTHRSNNETLALEGTNGQTNFSSLDRHLSLLEGIKNSKIPPDLVVLPESFFPAFSVLKKDWKKRLQRFEDLIPQAPSQVVFGLIIPQGKSMANTLTVGIRSSGKIKYYPIPKRRPMPLGETVPFKEFFPWLEDLFFDSVQAAPQKEDPMIFNSAGDIKWAGGICNEVFHSDLYAWGRRLGAKFGVSIGNEVWISGMAYHFLLAATVVRAVEMGMPMLKVVNAGYSVLVDDNGDILKKLSPGKEEAVNVAIPVKDRQPTFYSRFPYWFLSSCALWVLGALLFNFLKRRQVK